MKFFFVIFYFLFFLIARESQLQIGYFFKNNSIYPNAVPSIIKTIKKKTYLNVKQEPFLIDDFSNNGILDCQIIYINANEYDWKIKKDEILSVQKYLTSGGFLFIDAGISADFLIGGAASRQNFPEWKINKKIATFFKKIFPENEFFPLPRDHEVFKIFYSGLPNTEKLPKTVKKFVKEFKWPQGTISTMGFNLNGRIAVLATPIMAMGWSKDNFNRWTGRISFRVREEVPQDKKSLQEFEKVAFRSKYLTSREDGGFDFVYTESGDMPAWVKESDGRWKVFRYYSGNEINEYAHIFFERMGINFFIYGLTQ